MPVPKDTLWKLEPHTRGKHLVLRSYLNAWLPILGSRKKHLLFIDGFAGPGEYAGGEEGSPLIAMKALVDHTAKAAIGAKVGFLFIEKDERRAKHLLEVVERWKPKLPDGCQAAVITGKFDETMKDGLDNLDVQNKRLAPAFLMIDPFGVSGTPMSVIQRVMQNPQCEVYISLMYEAINRHTAEFSDHLDVLFGCEDWRGCANIEDSEERRTCLYDLYERQLRYAGARYVVHFDIYEDRRLIYSIFFATQHDLGCDRMKKAIWKIAPEGGYEYKGTHADQLRLGLEPDFEPLKRQLHKKFCDGEWYRIEQFEAYVRSDATDYHSGQLRKGALVPLEVDGHIEVDKTTRKRKNTYPKGCRLRFKNG